MKDLKLSIVLGGIDKATKPFKNIISVSGNLKKSLGGTAGELKALNKTQADLKGFRQLTRQTGESARALQQAQKEAQQLGRALSATDAPTKAMKREAAAAAKRVKQLKDRHAAQRRELHGLRGDLTRAGLNLKKMGTAEAELDRRTAKTTRTLDKQQRTLARLNNLKLKAGALGGAFQDARSGIAGLAKGGLAVGAGLGGLFAITNATAGLGDSSAKTADRLGLEIEALQELRYAGERSGIATANVDKSIEQLGKRTGEAVQGLGQARYAFEELGLSATDLKSLKPDETLGVLADRLMGVENQTERLALANQLFGRSGGQMLIMMKNGSAGLEELRENARQTGYVLGEQAARDSETFKDVLLDTELTLKGLRNTLGVELMPVFTDAMRTFGTWVRSNRELVKSFSADFAQGFKEAIPTILNTTKGLAAALGTVGAFTGFLADLAGGFDNLGIALGTIFIAKHVFSFLMLAKALLGVAGTAISLAPAILNIGGALAAVGKLLVLNPIGLAVTAIAGAAFLIWKYWTPITGFFKRLWDGVKRTFDGGLVSIGAAILNWSPLGLFYRAFSSVLSWFGLDLPKTFTGLGSAIIDGLVDGLTGGVKKALAAVASLGTRLKDGFKDVLGIRSPSREFARLGGFLTDGLAQGVDKGQARAVRSVRAMGKALPRAAAAGAVGLSVAAVPAYAGQAPGMAAAGGGDHIEIHIHAAPGADAAEIARLVRKELDEQGRKKAAGRRSRLFDA